MRISDWSSDVCSSDLLFLQMIGKAAGELEYRLGGGVVADQLGRAFPPDFDPGEQIGLCPRHAKQALRLETAVLAEDFGIGDKGNAGAASVRRRTQFFESAEREPARETLAIELLAARELDLGLDRQHVDDADADA